MRETVREPATPKRRRSVRFSLRLLLVVMAIVCALAAWANARMKRTYLRQMAAVSVSYAGGWIEYNPVDDRNWLTRFVDDRPMSAVGLPVGLSLEEADRIGQLYPEARIIWLDSSTH